MPALFPEIQPEELLYSAIARYQRMVRTPSTRTLLEELFGVGTGVAIVDLPTRIDKFVEHLPTGSAYTADRIISNHTTLPYYRWFLPPARFAAAVAAMRGGGTARVMSQLGLRASIVPTPSHLQYCTTCLREDLECGSGGFWRRTHQLPGVLVCTRHEAVLVKSTVSRTLRKSRREFTPLDKDALPEGGSSFEPPLRRELLNEIAEDTHWLLTSRGVPPDSLERLHRYQILLAGAGLATPKGYVWIDELRTRLVKKYGAAFLRQVGCMVSVDRSADDWLARLVRKPKSDGHPLQHILLARFLGSSIRELLAGERPRADDYPQPAKPEPSAALPRRSRGQRIGDPGAEWDRQLRELVLNETLNLSRIAELLGVSGMTVRRHAHRLGILRQDWGVPDRGVPSTPRSQQSENLREVYRTRWLTLSAANPNLGRSDFMQLEPNAYQWLVRKDKAWFEANLPPKRVSRGGAPRVNWQERDSNLLRAVAAAVGEILTHGGKPKRVTILEIGRRSGTPDRLMRDLPRLPRTAAYLDVLVEDQDQWHRRLLSWAAEQFRIECSAPPMYKLLRRAGLRANQLSPAVRSEMQQIVDNLRTEFG
jgi:hypothetical protein